MLITNVTVTVECERCGFQTDVSVDFIGSSQKTCKNHNYYTFTRADIVRKVATEGWRSDGGFLKCDSCCEEDCE